jgi:hypothetical protein
MLEFYEARAEDRWDPYPGNRKTELVTVTWSGKFADIRHLPHGNKACCGMILERRVGALF